MKLIIVIFLFLIYSMQLSAQIKVHKHLTTEDGLISNQVRDMFEDSKGYIWFGTDAGASRWDGTNFLNINENNGLLSPAVFDVTEGKDGTIFLATFGLKGINTFKDGIIDTLFSGGDNKLNFVSIVHSNKDGSLLIGSQNGIHLYDNSTLINLNEFYEIPAEPLYRSKANNIGEVFFATGNGILKYYNKKLEIISGYERGKTKFTPTLTIKNNNTLVYSTEQNIIEFQDGKTKVIEGFNQQYATETNDILYSKNNIGYFATNYGLGIVENNKMSFLTEENGLANKKLWRILEVSNGTIFLASSVGGIDVYRPKMLESFTNKNDLIGKSILNILIDKNGNRYFSTDAGLLIEEGGKRKIIDGKTRYGFDKYLSLAQTKNGNVIIGSHLGIDIYKDGAIKQLLAFKQTRDVQHKQTNLIQSIVELNDSTILLASYKGVYKIVGDSIFIMTKKDGLLSNYVSDLIATNDSSIIYGYHGSGISVYKNNGYTHINTSNGLTSDTILDIFERSDGAILVGTQTGGLNILNNNKIDTINVTDGLTSNEIRAINEDSNGNIYITTPTGLNIISKNDTGYHVRTITKKDGLAANDCNQNALFVDNSNNVWIGTTSGLSKYNAKFDTPLDSPSPILITGFEIFNELQSLKTFRTDSKLNYDQNYLKFIYTTINTLSPHKVRYRYRLSGIDKKWVESDKREVQYTSLDDGNYTFEVKARNEWGYWSQPAQLSFTINPAWWETWWFYTITALSLAGLIAFVASYRYRHLLAVEKVRTKISTDLHDNIGSGLTEITFLSEMVKSQVAGNENANKGLNNITSVSKTLIDDMRDIVWLINPSKDSLKDLFNRLQDSYQEVLKFSSISLNVDGIDNLSDVRLPMTYRQHIFLMFKEAINNSIKYASCKNINLNVEVNNNNLVVSLNDDGVGFDMHNTKMGNGIINIKKRAKQVNGEVFIDSSPKKGTSIKFSSKFSKFRFMEV